ncbi:MAG TPA: YbjN domain-containing protein, partial [Solirubrobacteraceae bacterium]
EPGRLDEHDLLWWNRTVPLIRFTHTRAGEVWVQFDLPLAAVNAGELDRWLGLLVLSATQARQHAYGPGPGSAGSPSARA